MEKNSINLLEPHLVQKIWGGTRLKGLKNLTIENESLGQVGETWEISIHPDGPSSLNGTALDKILSFEDLPYLAKLIDTTDHLSIQVHPDDEFAMKHESSQGKTECWVVLDCDKGAGIYLGLKNSTTRDDFEDVLKKGGDLSALMEFYECSPGDFFYVPAGSIHAIGKGVFLAEVQQSSGITYRVWDWNRVDSEGKGRELHIDKALQVINFEKSKNTSKHFQVQNGLFDIKAPLRLVEHPQFFLEIIPVKAGQVFPIKLKKIGRVNSCLVLNGSGEIKRESVNENYSEYQAFLFANEGEQDVEFIASKDSLILVMG